MNIWLSLVLVAVVGFVAYNIGFDQGAESAPETVAFELQKIELEHARVTELATIAATRVVNEAECLERIVSSDFDLFAYCEETVVGSLRREDEERNQIGDEMQSE